VAKYYQNICLPQNELPKDIKNTPSGITYDFIFGDLKLSTVIYDRNAKGYGPNPIEYFF